MPRVATTTWPSSARSPCPASAGKAPRRTSWREGERVTALPRGVPGSRSSDRPRGDSLTPSPLSHSVGEGVKFVWGRVKPSPTPPGCRGAAASEPKPRLVRRRRGEHARRGVKFPRIPGLPLGGRFSGEAPCQQRGQRLPGEGQALPGPRGCRRAVVSRGSPPVVSRGGGGGPGLPPRPRIAVAGRLPAGCLPLSGDDGATCLGARSSREPPGCRGAGPRVSGDAGRGGREAADGSGRTPRAVGVPRGSGIR